MDLVIFGIGGMAREVHQLVEDNHSSVNFVKTHELQPALNFIGFLNGYEETHGTKVHGFPVLGGLDWLKDKRDLGIVIGIGDPVVRQKIANKVKEVAPSISFPTLVHKTATIGNRISIGEGTIVGAGVHITTDVEIGNHVILNTGCTITHDDKIEDFATISPSANLSGDVCIKTGCYIGTNSTIIQHTKIGEWSIIGAGTVVLRDLPSNITAVGNPAKIIKEREPDWYEKIYVRI